MLTSHQVETFMKRKELQTATVEHFRPGRVGPFDYDTKELVLLSTKQQLARRVGFPDVQAKFVRHKVTGDLYVLVLSPSHPDFKLEGMVPEGICDEPIRIKGKTHKDASEPCVTYCGLSQIRFDDPKNFPFWLALTLPDWGQVPTVESP